MWIALLIAALVYVLWASDDCWLDEHRKPDEKFETLKYSDPDTVEIEF